MKTNKKRPLIITAFSPIPGKPLRLTVNEAYANAIKKAGGEMCMLAVAQTKGGAKRMLDIADGLLLTGGGDVSPRLYGRRKKSWTANVSPKRDRLESVMLGGAFERKMPILAICRGMQMLNVFMGGTLWQDIQNERLETPKWLVIDHGNHDNPNRSFLAHKVVLRPGTEIRNIMGMPEVRVNSMHHQGIRRLGAGLETTAHAPDGLVEAVELEHRPFFCVGVQWHPEELIADPDWQGLFDVFVDEAKKYRSSCA